MQFQHAMATMQPYVTSPYRLRKLGLICLWGLLLVVAMTFVVNAEVITYSMEENITLSGTTEIAAGNEIEIVGNTTDDTLTNKGTLIVRGKLVLKDVCLFNAGGIHIHPGGMIFVRFTFTQEMFCPWEKTKALVYNQGLVDNQGELVLESETPMWNVGTLDNSGVLVTHGNSISWHPADIYNEGLLINRTLINLGEGLFNCGIIDNAGTIDIEATAVVDNGRLDYGLLCYADSAQAILNRSSGEIVGLEFAWLGPAVTASRIKNRGTLHNEGLIEILDLYNREHGLLNNCRTVVVDWFSNHDTATATNFMQHSGDAATFSVEESDPEGGTYVDMTTTPCPDGLEAVGLSSFDLGDITIPLPGEGPSDDSDDAFPWEPDDPAPPPAEPCERMEEGCPPPEEPR